MIRDLIREAGGPVRFVLGGAICAAFVCAAPLALAVGWAAFGGTP